MKSADVKALVAVTLVTSLVVTGFVAGESLVTLVGGLLLSRPPAADMVVDRFRGQ